MRYKITYKTPASIHTTHTDDLENTLNTLVEQYYVPISVSECFK